VVMVLRCGLAPRKRVGCDGGVGRVWPMGRGREPVSREPRGMDRRAS
jgi:hypothetical protein